MISDEYYELIAKLVKRTLSGEVNWKATSDDNQFVLYFNNFSLSVYQATDQNSGEEFARIVLLNDDGKEIDSFWVSERDEHWEIASNLFTGARRKALKIDEALHTILDELDGDGTVGKKEAPNKKTPFDDDIPF